MPLELRDIEYFAVVADHGNVGRAAEALGLGQPALSKSLRRLEKSAQAKLVKRTPKGVDLTAAGEALLAHVQRLRLVLEDVAQEIADVAQGRTGHLRVGAAAGFGEYLLMPICSSFLAAAPKATLKIVVGTNDLLMPALRRGELDLLLTGIIPAPGQSLVQEALFHDDHVFYASTSHRLAERARISLADVAAEGWVVPNANANMLVWRTLLHALDERGLPHPRVVMETTSLLLRLQTVSDSAFVGFTSRVLLEQFKNNFALAELPVTDFKNSREVGISYRRDAYLPPVARRFIDRLKEHAVT